MPGILLKSETKDGIADERHRIARQLTEALVSARHETVLEAYGLSAADLAQPYMEVLPPEQSDPKRHLKPVRVRGESVLRGK